MPATLVTIAPSHYCEKARWALDRAGWRWSEQRHIPLLHMLVTVPTTRQRQVPVLVTPHGRITDSTAILEFLDRSLAEPDRLFPEGELRSEVAALEDEFDRRLGPATRRLAYFHILGNEKLLVDTLAAGMGSVPRAVTRALRAPIRLGIGRGLRVTAQGAEKSKQRILEIFDATDRRLDGGRRYLVGDRFTAADLGFASLAAPVLLPPEYGSWLPTLDELPPELVAFVTALRERPAGKLVMRLFKEERKKRVASAAKD